MEITKDLTLGKLLDEHPETADVLLAVGMHCLGCPSARAETIEEAAYVHGLDADKLVDLIKSHVKK